MISYDLIIYSPRPFPRGIRNTNEPVSEQRPTMRLPDRINRLLQLEDAADPVDIQLDY